MDREKNKQNETTNDLIDITSLVDSLWNDFKRIWIILAAVIVILTCGTVLYMKLTYHPYYTASATFVVNTYTASNYNANTYNEQAASQMAKTFPYILNSGILRELIGADLGTGGIPGSLSAEAMEDTNLFTLKATAGDGNTAFSILQSAMINYPKISDQVVGETTLELLDETGVPSSPTNPFSYKRCIEIGIVVGVVVDIVVLLVYSLLRTTIKTEDDFKKFLNIKCLGSVPLAKFKKRTGKIKEPVTIDNTRAPYYFKESLRSIRTRFSRRLDEKDAHIIVVTSAMPHEGKSTVSINLALSLAAKGEKVLLVDGDLRKPSIAGELGMGDYKGDDFGTVLRVPEILEKAIVNYKDTSLKLLLGVKPIKKPTKLLGSIKKNDFFNKLKNYADYIIIDTPPSALVSDASIMAAAADGTVFVVRQDYIQRDRIIEGVNMIAEANKNFIGCILNQTQPGITKRSYGGYMGYGYGDKEYGAAK